MRADARLRETDRGDDLADAALPALKHFQDAKPGGVAQDTKKTGGGGRVDSRGRRGGHIWKTRYHQLVVKIELLHVAGCANVAGTRSLVQACLVETGIHAQVKEWVGAYPSPTVLVDGADVMGRPEAEGAMCRLDIPTRDRLLAALRK